MTHSTQIFLRLDYLTRNMKLLQQLAGNRPLWPAIKANAYGHGAEVIGSHLISLGYKTLCVAHSFEAAELADAGLKATFIVLSAMLPEHSECIAEYGFEPAVCTVEMIESLSRAASKFRKQIAVHLKVDTGMGRVGIRPDEVTEFLRRCRDLPGIFVKGIMSHFPRADEADKSFSLRQIEIFRQIRKISQGYGISIYHLANSAGIFDLPDAAFDAARPGISIYGLKPSLSMQNPLVNELKPVLTWKTRITFLKEVPAGTGLSYGHTFHTDKASLIASIPLGYGDGISRLLSGKMEVLIHGLRCPQVGRICMDQSLIDVTALRGNVGLGDEAVIIGRQGDEEITADEIAEKIGTINYEIVTGISRRIPRIATGFP